MIEKSQSVGKSDGGGTAAASERSGAPFHLTTFIGRERELAEVSALVAANRLVTLGGSGGCGKTRLAVETVASAKDFSGDPIWVELGPLSEEGAVARAVANALGLQEWPLLPPVELLARSLGDARTLLVLDNCEHLIEACSVLAAELLPRCPSLHILATSREPLGVPGEITFRVPSLAVPDNPDVCSAGSAVAYDAIRLFVDRARRIRPNFALTDENAPAIAGICRRLDGIPLALELAAARTRMMSIADIAKGLDDRFHLLTGGSRTAVPRQRTLLASIAWSYELLSAPERALMQRLSVFVGSFTLDGAERVGTGSNVKAIEILDLLSRLVERSIVQVGEIARETRYWLLESIRDFGLSRLSENETESIAARNGHLEYIRAFSERARHGLATSDVFTWLDRLDEEYDDIVAARTWSEQTDRSDHVVVTTNLGTYWRVRGHESERTLARLPDALIDDGLPAEIRARGALLLAELLYRQWDLAGVERHAEQSCEIASAEGLDVIAGRATVWRGIAASYRQQPEEAQRYFDQALDLAEKTNDGVTRAGALSGSAEIHLATGDWNRARPLFEQGLDAARGAHDVLLIVETLHFLFLVNWMLGRDAEAERDAREGIELATKLRDQARRAIFGSHCACLAAHRGQFAEAHDGLERSFTLARLSPSLFPIAFWNNARLHLARYEGDLPRAEEMARAHGELASAVGIHVPACQAFAIAAELAAIRGDGDGAATLVEHAWSERRAAGAALPFAPWAESIVAFHAREFAVGEERAHAALTDAVALEFEPTAVQCLTTLAWLASAVESPVEASRLLGAAKAAWERIGRSEPAPSMALTDAAVTAAREAIGAEAVEAAFAEGLGLSLEQAIAYARRGRGERKRPSAGWGSLTPMQRDVVALVAEGLSNADIGRRLFISVATVKTHLNHVYAQLGIDSRVQLATAFKQRQN